VEKSQELKLRKLIREELKQTQLKESSTINWERLIDDLEGLYDEEGDISLYILDSIRDNYSALKNLDNLDKAVAEINQALAPTKIQLTKKIFKKHGII